MLPAALAAKDPDWKTGVLLELSDVREDSPNDGYLKLHSRRIWRCSITDPDRIYEGELYSGVATAPLIEVNSRVEFALEPPTKRKPAQLLVRNAGAKTVYAFQLLKTIRKP